MARAAAEAGTAGAAQAPGREAAGDATPEDSAGGRGHDPAAAGGGPRCNDKYGYWAWIDNSNRNFGICRRTRAGQNVGAVQFMKFTGAG